MLIFKKKMKYFLAIALFCSYTSVICQSVINWEPEISVADGTLFGNIRPRIALSADDIPVVIFGKGVNGLLHTARLNGSSFDSPISILPVNVETYLAGWTGPDMAAKGDTVIAVFKALPIEGGKIYSVRSTDGGQTWSDTIRADSHNNGGVAWLPSLDLDENSNPSVIYMAHDATWTHPRYIVAHSIDQGLSFEPEMDIALSIPDEACDCCPAEYVIDGSNHALLYRNNASNIRDIYSLYSSDDGLSYGQFTNVDQLDWNISSCPSTGPHGTFNSDILVTVYASRGNGNYRVYISESTVSPTFAFENRTMMTPPLNTNGIQNYPRISGQNDTLVMVWQESESSNPEIYSAITTIGNSSELLASKAIVNTSVSGSQTNPDVIYANGKVHVVFQDALTGDVIYKKGSIGTLGLNEATDSHFSVFPNPSATGQFTLRGLDVENVSIQLTDALGKECEYYLTKSANNIHVNIKDDLKGVFFLKTNHGGNAKTYILLNN